MPSAELIKELEKIPCTLDKKHQLRLKKFDSKKKTFVLECPDCEKDLGITNKLKGTWNPTQKKVKSNA